MKLVQFVNKAMKFVSGINIIKECTDVVNNVTKLVEFYKIFGMYEQC